MSFTVVKAERF